VARSYAGCPQCFECDVYPTLAKKERQEMRKKHLLKTALTLTMLIGVAVYVNAFVAYNDIPPIFETNKSAAMETLTVSGTSFFLKSNADVFLLLNEVEVGYPNNLNFSQALSYVDSAIYKLDMAKNKYLLIIKQGENIHYVSKMVDRLQTFDYTGFATNRNLNNDVMTRVQGYLANGDIIGLYRKNIANIDTILILLNEIRYMLTTGVHPDMNKFWSLLQQYSDAILLGNYATVVFNHM
jgi:hypothetical protein